MKSKLLYVCRCDDGYYEIWTIKPRWNGYDFVHPTSGEGYPAEEYAGSFNEGCARLLLPDAIKGLRVGRSREV